MMENPQENNIHKSGKVFLAINWAFYMGLGILFLINPAGMSEGLGYAGLNKAGLTDIMATYGGLFIGIGILLYLNWKQDQIELGLKIVFWTYFGFALGRSIAVIRFGGFYGLHCYWLSFELVWLLITKQFLRKLINREEIQQ